VLEQAESGRVLRGASWDDLGFLDIFASYRHFDFYGSRRSEIGFRCVVAVESSVKLLLSFSQLSSCLKPSEGRNYKCFPFNNLLYNATALTFFAIPSLGARHAGYVGQSLGWASIETRLRAPGGLRDLAGEKSLVERLLHRTGPSPFASGRSPAKSRR
jgi:hypothetical protein